MRHRRSSFEIVKSQRWSRRHNSQSRNVQTNQQRNFNSNDSWNENAKTDENNDWNFTGSKPFRTTDLRRPVHMFGNNDTFLDARENDSDIENTLPPITFQSNHHLDTTTSLPSFASFFDGGSNHWHSVPGNTTMQNSGLDNDSWNLTSCARKCYDPSVNIPCCEINANQSSENFYKYGYSHSSTHVTSFASNVQPTFSDGWNVNLSMERTFDMSDMSFLFLPPPPPPPPLSPPRHSLKIGTMNVQSTNDESNMTTYKPYFGCNKNRDAGLMKCKKKMGTYTSNFDDTFTEREQIIQPSNDHNNMEEEFQNSIGKKNERNMSVSLNSTVFQNSSNVSESCEQKFIQYQKPYMWSSGTGIHNLGYLDKESFGAQPEYPHIQHPGLIPSGQETSFGAVSLIQPLLKHSPFPDNKNQISAEEASHSKDTNNNFKGRQGAGWIRSKMLVPGNTQNKNKLYRPWESTSQKGKYHGRKLETRDTFRHRNRLSQQGNKYSMNRPDRMSCLTSHSSRPCYTKSVHRNTGKFKHYHGVHSENDLSEGNKRLFSSSSSLQRVCNYEGHTSTNGQFSKGSDEMSVSASKYVNPEKDYMELQDVTGSTCPVSHHDVSEKQNEVESNKDRVLSSNEVHVQVTVAQEVPQVESNSQVECSSTEVEQPSYHHGEAENSPDEVDKSFLKKRQDKFNNGKPFTEIIPVLASNRGPTIRKRVRSENEICAATSSTDIESSKAETSFKFNSSSFNARNVVLPLQPSTVAMPLVNIDMSKLSDAVPKVNRFLTSLSKIAKPEICLENKYLKSTEKISLCNSVRSISHFKIPWLKSTIANNRSKMTSNVKSGQKKIVCVSPIINKAAKRGKVKEGKEINVLCPKKKEMKTKLKVTNRHINQQKFTTDNNKLITKSIALQSTKQTKLHPKLRHKINILDAKSVCKYKENCVKDQVKKLDKTIKDCLSHSSNTSKDASVKNVQLSFGDSSKEKYNAKLALLPCCLKRGKFEMSTPNTFTVKGLPTKKTVIEKSESNTDVNMESFNKAMLSAKKHLLYRAMAMQAITKDKTTVQVKKNRQRTSCVTKDMVERKIKNSLEPLHCEVSSCDKVSLTSDTYEVDVNNNIVDSSEGDDKTRKKNCNDLSNDYVPLRTTADCILTQCISGPQVSPAVQKSCSNITNLSNHENNKFNDTKTEVKGKSIMTEAEDVSVSTSQPVTVLCVNDTCETSYDSESTEYYASKLNVKPRKDINSCKSSGELPFKADLVSTNCVSKGVELSSEIPYESVLNKSQIEMYQRYILSKLDIVSLSDKSSEEAVQSIPGLPALLPQVPAQQTGIALKVLSSPGHTDNLDNCNSNQNQQSPSCTQNQIRFSPTVEDFERYKIDQIERVKSLGVDRKGSPYISPEISCNSPAPLSDDVIYEQQHSSPCSLWDNTCSPKIVCVESLAQCNDPDITSSLHANPMIEFVNDIQYSPEAIFDEIVDDILKDNDLISSITETSEKTDQTTTTDSDINDENEYKGKLNTGKLMEACSAELQNTPSSDGKCEFVSSRSPSCHSNITHRFQKRFPKPLPRSKMINKEKELYKAAKEFLGDFDHSSKRSCRDIVKDGTFLINENTSKLGIAESEGKATKETISEIEKGSELHSIQSGKKETIGQDNDVGSMKTKESVKSKPTVEQKDSQSYNVQCREVNNEMERSLLIKKRETEKEVDTEETKSKKKVKAIQQKAKMHVPTLRLKSIRSKNGKESTKSSHIKWKAILSNVTHAKNEMSGDCMTSKLKGKSCDKKKIHSPQLTGISSLNKATDMRYFCEVCNFPCDSEMSHRLHFNFYHSLWCFKCAKMCPDEEARKKHLEEAHNIVASCKVCCTNFLSKSKYTHHLLSQYHADNVKKLDHVKKDALYSNNSLNSSEMVIISDDDVSNTDDSKLHNELNSRVGDKKPKREQSDQDKGHKCKIPVKSVKTKVSNLTGVKRKHGKDVGTTDSGKKKSRPSVVQYCVLCKQFYKKFRAHKTTLKHMEKEMALK